MILNNILIVLSPIFIFYIIYWRYFHFQPELLKHFQAFIAGITAALFLALISPIIQSIITTDNIFITGFIKAALTEKILALVVIFIIHKQYPNFSILEAMLSAILYALGFSAVENIFYSSSYGISNSLTRIYFSVPMHLTTCGILGYYLGKVRFSSTKTYKIYFITTGFLISFLSHAIFDIILLSKNNYIYYSAPLLILLVLLHEYKLTRAITIPCKDILEALQIRFEDWLLMRRQPRYERWISQSMEKSENLSVSPFLWRPTILRILLVLTFLSLAIVGYMLKNSIIYSFQFKLLKQEELLLFLIFPLSISITTIIVGAINPDFFKYSEIKIPIITDVVLNKDSDLEETYVTYDFSISNCFLRTFEPFGIGKKLYFNLELPHFSSQQVYGQVVWERHIPGQTPYGSIIKILKSPKNFQYFIFKYLFFRLRKGIVFNLKLPGFESIKKLFISPITTMQDEVIIKTGEILFNEGEKAKEFYLLKKGKISIYKQKGEKESIELNQIEEGQIFGEMSVFWGKTRNASAKAIENSILAKADKSNLKTLVRSNPEFALNLFQKMSERIHNSEDVLITNIQYLERQKLEMQKLLDTVSLLLLIVLGNKIDLHDKDIDLVDINQIVQNIDDNIVVELASILLSNKETEKLNEIEKEKAYKTLSNILNKINN